jgi:hypothetical protein
MTNSLLPSGLPEPAIVRREMPSRRFIVAAMFTQDAEPLARQLEASLQSMGLDHVLYRVPSVHRSISVRGSDDLTFSKPHFIRQVLENENVPVLYLDADTVVRDAPTAIMKLEADGVEFAVYNWLADMTTDCYRPVSITYKGRDTTDRFYAFSHSIDLYDPTQLICSGAVQFYRKTNAIDRLLSVWFERVRKFPRVADDELLDDAFNHGLSIHERPKASWLGKDYCRYAWWIYVRPVIDHPQFPAATADHSRSFMATAGANRFNPERVRKLSRPPFPRNVLLDLEDRRILEVPPPEKWASRSVNLWR